MKKKISLAIILYSIFIIISCINKKPIAGINIPEDAIMNVPDKVELDVVYIPQNDMKSCATTSVAMAISYYENLNDKPLDKETVWEISGTDENIVYKYGNDMQGLERIAHFYGYKSEYATHMTISDIEFLLSKGILVVLNIKVKPDGSATHAFLVTGYDKKRELFFINDSANNMNKIFKYSDLKTRWSAYLSSPRGMSHRSGFIIYPKNIEFDFTD